MIAIVEYQVATYKGKIVVNCKPDDENEIIIAKAKSNLRSKYGPLPFGYQSFKVIDRI